MPRLIREALEKAEVDDLGRVSSGIDMVGDIAIVRLTGFSRREKLKVAGALLEVVRNLKVVLEQSGGVEGEFRLRKLTRLGGEKRTLTLHRENGCSFRVDVARCYFSPRLSTERLLVARKARSGERVLNMFAGVGPFSIPLAKLAGARVVSCEVNGYAAKLHEENDRLNKVEDLVSVIHGDAADLPEMVPSKFDRILMPLPSMANRYLPVALRCAGRGATVHYYRHVLGEDEREASRELGRELKELLPRGAKYRARRVREVGPRWVEMAADVRLPA